MDAIHFSDMEEYVAQYVDPSQFFDDEEADPTSKNTLNAYIEYMFTDYVKGVVLNDISCSNLPDNVKNYLMDVACSHIEVNLNSNDLLDFYAGTTKILDMYNAFVKGNSTNA